MLDRVDGELLWRYMGPEAGPLESAPPGFGDGAVAPLEGVHAVVGVVGSAHVRGMVREWGEHVVDTDVSKLLAV